MQKASQQSCHWKCTEKTAKRNNVNSNSSWNTRSAVVECWFMYYWIQDQIYILLNSSKVAVLHPFLKHSRCWGQREPPGRKSFTAVEAIMEKFLSHIATHHISGAWPLMEKPLFRWSKTPPWRHSSPAALQGGEGGGAAMEKALCRWFKLPCRFTRGKVILTYCFAAGYCTFNWTSIPLEFKALC